MSIKRSYKVLKPVRLDGIGTVQPGDTVELHPRQAVFLVTGGTLEKADAATETNKPKPTKKEATK